jgi:hypothetical protein
VGLRETLNQNPRYATIATIGFIVLALGLMIWQLSGSGSGTVDAGSGKFYYTDDDGKNLFADLPSRIAPFSGPSGKEAVRARVFKCGDKQVIGWLEKFNPEAKPALEQYYGLPENAKRSPWDVDENTNRMVKDPGKPQWIPVDKFPDAAAKIRTVKCDNGEVPAEVFP